MMTTQEFIRRVLPTRFVEKGRDYSGVDCWGVVYLYFRDVLGIGLPTYVDDYEPEDVRGSPALAALVRREAESWRQVERPAIGDVVVFLISGREVHTGLIISAGRVLHAERRLGVFIERLDSPMWARRLEGIYRYHAND